MAAALPALTAVLQVLMAAEPEEALLLARRRHVWWPAGVGVRRGCVARTAEVLFLCLRRLRLRRLFPAVCTFIFIGRRRLRGSNGGAQVCVRFSAQRGWANGCGRCPAYFSWKSRVGGRFAA